MKKIITGQHVAVHYTGTLDNGEVFDTSEGGAPLKFTVGRGTVIEGFDSALIGMAIGEEKKFKITPDRGYGDRDESMVIKVEREEFGDDQEPEVGMAVGVQMEDGESAMGTITAISAKKITVDLNHPLAGKILNFQIKVLEVKNPGEPGTEDWDDTHSHNCGEESCGSCHSETDCCGGGH